MATNRSNRKSLFTSLRKMSEGKALLIGVGLAVVGTIVVLLVHAGGYGAGGSYPLYWTLDTDHSYQATTLDGGLGSNPWQACILASNTGSTEASLSFAVNAVGKSPALANLRVKIPASATDLKEYCLTPSFKVDQGTAIELAGSVDYGSIYVDSINFGVTAFPPTNLHDTGTTSSSVNLAWDAFDPCDPEGCGVLPGAGKAYAGGGPAFTYKIYRSAVNSSAAPTLVTSTPGTTYTDTGLNPGSAYSYYVVTVDQWGTESERSNAWIAMTAAETSLNPPTQLYANNIGETSLDLHWLAPNNSRWTQFSVHQVYFANFFDPVPTDKVIGMTPQTDWNVIGLTAGTEYWYYVVAEYPNGKAKSSVAYVTTADNTAPSVPVGVRIATVTQRTLSLRWKPSKDNSGMVEGYVIYRDGKEIARVSHNSFVNFKLKPNTSYSYRVASFDLKGNVSSKSMAVKGKTEALPSNVRCGWSLANGWFQYVCHPVKK